MSNPAKKKLMLKQRRAHRTRARIFGTATKPRLSVFRSNQHLYAQLIDDATGRTLCAVNDSAATLGHKSMEKRGVERANMLGAALALKAKEQNIVEAVFDRGPYRYHGQVKSLADGAREAGLKF